MSETTPNAKGPARIQGTPAATGPALIPADQVKPEDVAKLAIEYRDGQPVIVVSGGKFVPARLTVADSNGAEVGAFEVALNTAKKEALIGAVGFFWERIDPDDELGMEIIPPVR